MTASCPRSKVSLRRTECLNNARKVYVGFALAGSVAHADRQGDLGLVCE